MDPAVTFLYLRISGPLQSWAGEKITGNFSFTDQIPTRSAVIGLLAGALGANRGQWPEWLEQITLSVRVDKRGEFIDEYATINPRPETKNYQKRLFRLTTGEDSTNKRRRDKESEKEIIFTPNAGGGSDIVERTFISDGEFILRIGAPSEEQLRQLNQAIAEPNFVSYLGRKSFAPGFPFYLGVGEENIFEEIPLFVDNQANSENPEKQSILVFDLQPYGVKQQRMIQVPTSTDREEWLEKIAALPLKRRS